MSWFDDNIGSTSDNMSDITGGKAAGSDLPGVGSQAGAAAGIGLVGLGIGLYGMLGAQKAAKQESAISMQEAGVEEQQNRVRQQAMQLDAAHKRVTIAQQTQLAMAQGKAASVASGAGIMGANVSSGYKGGQGQAEAKGAYNTLGINQGEELGNQMFNLTDQLDQYKIQMMQAQSKQATNQGWINFGESVLGSAGNIAKLAAGA